ncbi:hypothetical protein ThvES_00019430 [Thiovulum sp. ES]|nr:hypothetical protein ThvES_00019430 [Thiovulum sp. ES]
MVEVIKDYPVVFEKAVDGYGIYVPFLDGCVSYGDTFEEGVKNIKEALTLHLSGMIDYDEVVPEFDFEEIRKNLAENKFLVFIEPDRTLLKGLLKKGKVKRINITIDEYLLEYTDLRVKELNTTRSALIESGLRAILN